MLYTVEEPRPQVEHVDVDQLVERAFEFIKNWPGKKQMFGCSDESLRHDLKTVLSKAQIKLLGNGFDFAKGLEKGGWPADTALSEIGDIVLGPELDDLKTELVKKWAKDNSLDSQFCDLDGKKVIFNLNRKKAVEGVVTGGDAVTFTYHIHTPDQAESASYIVPAEAVVEVCNE